MLGGLVVNYVVHEVGHLLGAGITGLRGRGVVLFGVRFGRGLNGLRGVGHKNAVVVSRVARLWRLRFGILVLSGSLANLALGLVAAGMFTAQTSVWAGDALVGLALAAISLGLVNLAPWVTRKGEVRGGGTGPLIRRASGSPEPL
ncbi:hypothetical protein ORV05_03685 [Amycolatopsis cynarae]|uniref:Peptidase M50 domain-containing protein n=1 Tax=Amycolatopsis cynarae TaxID=2995223 RepID=A0ABY7B4P7_9PSEU|nr:hypothetical protein [Amycolatopsis sp. HUAS 11-8]WAL66914.1 hypothetical protein ORV05_03685 [Amycolatopsis sp. HUAS 11-8]